MVAVRTSVKEGFLLAIFNESVGGGHVRFVVEIDCKHPDRLCEEILSVAQHYSYGGDT